ncbi:MAG: branched-chain amino acid ABC transporter substrate-binding protein [Verrucomicrobiota bacterium]
MKRYLPLLFLGLCVLGCQKSSDTIKIGLAGVMTGSNGQIGSAMIYGSQIAVEEWNEKGGVLGKKIEVVVRDDEGKPDKAVAVAQEISAQGVVAVLGHFNSGCTIPSSTIYHENHILQVTPGSTNPKVTEQGFPNLFRLVGRDDQVAVHAAEYAIQKLKIKKFAILNNKTTYGSGVAEEFRKYVISQGAEVVLFDGVAEQELDFRANIAAIKSKGAQALFWGGMYDQGGPLVVQMRQDGLAIPLFGGDGLMNSELLKSLGNLGENVFISFWPDHNQIPAAQPFIQKYTAKYGSVEPYSLYGYDAANVLFSAIQKAGTTDVDQVSAVLKSQPFETLFGPIEFDAKGDLKQVHLKIWTVKDGKFVVVE